MQLLIDTHVLIWWLAGDARLSDTVRRLIGHADNDVVVSAASAWEIATKYRLGKLPSAAALAADIPGAVRSQGLRELAVTMDYAQRAGWLGGAHRVLFDRMLIAQSLIEQSPVASIDSAFDAYAVQRIW